MAITIDNAMKEAQMELRAFYDKFPSSPAAQSLELQHTQEEAEKPGPRGFKVKPKLDLVVSVEAPGAGNLQGYFNYALNFGTVKKMLHE